MVLAPVIESAQTSVIGPIKNISLGDESISDSVLDMLDISSMESIQENLTKNIVEFWKTMFEIPPTETSSYVCLSSFGKILVGISDNCHRNGCYSKLNIYSKLILEEDSEEGYKCRRNSKLEKNEAYISNKLDSSPCNCTSLPKILSNAIRNQLSGSNVLWLSYLMNSLSSYNLIHLLSEIISELAQDNTLRLIPYILSLFGDIDNSEVTKQCNCILDKNLEDFGNNEYLSFCLCNSDPQYCASIDLRFKKYITKAEFVGLTFGVFNLNCFFDHNKWTQLRLIKLCLNDEEFRRKYKFKTPGFVDGQNSEVLTSIISTKFIRKLLESIGFDEILIQEIFDTTAAIILLSEIELQYDTNESSETSTGNISVTNTSIHKFRECGKLLEIEDRCLLKLLQIYQGDGMNQGPTSSYTATTTPVRSSDSVPTTTNASINLSNMISSPIRVYRSIAIQKLRAISLIYKNLVGKVFTKLEEVLKSRSVSPNSTVKSDIPEIPNSKLNLHFIKSDSLELSLLIGLNTSTSEIRPLYELCSSTIVDNLICRMHEKWRDVTYGILLDENISGVLNSKYTYMLQFVDKNYQKHLQNITPSNLGVIVSNLVSANSNNSQFEYCKKNTTQYNNEYTLPVEYSIINNDYYCNYNSISYLLSSSYAQNQNIALTNYNYHQQYSTHSLNNYFRNGNNCSNNNLVNFGSSLTMNICHSFGEVKYLIPRSVIIDASQGANDILEIFPEYKFIDLMYLIDKINTSNVISVGIVLKSNLDNFSYLSYKSQPFSFSNLVLPFWFNWYLGLDIQYTHQEFVELYGPLVFLSPIRYFKNRENCSLSEATSTSKDLREQDTINKMGYMSKLYLPKSFNINNKYRYALISRHLLNDLSALRFIPRHTLLDIHIISEGICATPIAKMVLENMREDLLPRINTLLGPCITITEVFLEHFLDAFDRSCDINVSTQVLIEVSKTPRRTLSNILLLLFQLPISLENHLRKELLDSLSKINIPGYFLEMIYENVNNLSDNSDLPYESAKFIPKITSHSQLTNLIGYFLWYLKFSEVHDKSAYLNIIDYFNKPQCVSILVKSNFSFMQAYKSVLAVLSYENNRTNKEVMEAYISYESLVKPRTISPAIGIIQSNESCYYLLPRENFMNVEIRELVTYNLPKKAIFQGDLLENHTFSEKDRNFKICDNNSLTVKNSSKQIQVSNSNSGSSQNTQMLSHFLTINTSNILLDLQEAMNGYNEVLIINNLATLYSIGCIPSSYPDPSNLNVTILKNSSTLAGTKSCKSSLKGGVTSALIDAAYKLLSDINDVDWISNTIDNVCNSISWNSCRNGWRIPQLNRLLKKATSLGVHQQHLRNAYRILEYLSSLSYYQITSKKDLLERFGVNSSEGAMEIGINLLKGASVLPDDSSNDLQFTGLSSAVIEKRPSLKYPSAAYIPQNNDSPWLGALILVSFSQLRCIQGLRENGTFFIDRESSTTRGNKDAVQFRNRSSNSPVINKPSGINKAKLTSSSSYNYFKFSRSTIKLNRMKVKQIGDVYDQLKFTCKPIRKSLTLQTDKKLNKLACIMYNCILEFCQGNIFISDPCLMYGVIYTALINPSLIDEVYVQIMKILTNNPYKTIETMAWRFLQTVCQYLSPSEELFYYIRQFLIDARGYCDDDIARISIQAYEDLNITYVHQNDILPFTGVISDSFIQLNVYSLDGSNHRIFVPYNAKFQQVLESAIHMLQLPSTDGWSLWERKYDYSGKNETNRKPDQDSRFDEYHKTLNTRNFILSSFSESFGFIMNYEEKSQYLTYLIGQYGGEKFLDYFANKATGDYGTTVTRRFDLRKLYISSIRSKYYAFKSGKIPIANAAIPGDISCHFSPKYQTILNLKYISTETCVLDFYKKYKSDSKHPFPEIFLRRSYLSPLMNDDIPSNHHTFVRLVYSQSVIEFIFYPLFEAKFLSLCDIILNILYFEGNAGRLLEIYKRKISNSSNKNSNSTCNSLLTEINENVFSPLLQSRDMINNYTKKDSGNFGCHRPRKYKWNVNYFWVIPLRYRWIYSRGKLLQGIFNSLCNNTDIRNSSPQVINRMRSLPIRRRYTTIESAWEIQSMCKLIDSMKINLKGYGGITWAVETCILGLNILQNISLVYSNPSFELQVGGLGRLEMSLPILNPILRPSRLDKFLSCLISSLNNNAVNWEIINETRKSGSSKTNFNQNSIINRRVPWNDLIAFDPCYLFTLTRDHLILSASDSPWRDRATTEFNLYQILGIESLNNFSFGFDSCIVLAIEVNSLPQILCLRLRGGNVDDILDVISKGELNIK
ncbi:uncharacterized protein CMU_022950 [Cryptosporidium muris RN66]|uniref:MyTH4 domain-containing protein n=1 Tax=Cryptosporidium muris (strain RN66) TaxID=441375 RepID=B6ABT7_CRYMR|nr:uncharacterized protein CMU_022950 [Cryptosporidium muris RN66]EEA05290.1 hypothetical protein CMU_022950 [Cryptosporidium muris RN66]|eukprot:XP_002139639.1 hypothetical protein [Cryptosporidium muris RN66]